MLSAYQRHSGFNVTNAGSDSEVSIPSLMINNLELITSELANSTAIDNLEDTLN